MTDQEICGACDGSRRMPRDPDIGTDQECFVCDGSGVIAAHEAKAAPAVPEKLPSGMATSQADGKWRVTLEFDAHSDAAALHDYMLRNGVPSKSMVAAPAVPDDVLEALRDALSVCSSVSVSRDRKIVRDGCTLYAQTEEWCNWAENEVAPKIRAAIELAATPAAPSQEPAVPQGEPDFWGSGDGCWVRATDKLARPDASRFNIPLYAAPSQPVNRPQNCGTSFCSCIECVCEPPLPVTLTDEEIFRCAALTLGEQHVENCGLGDIKEFARAIIAALREKEQAT